jgi:predicted nucleic acid-binding protein
MIIVSDTGPLHYLIQIGEINVLETLAGLVLIPQAVYDELQAPNTPQSVKTWLDSHPAWIEVRQANTSLFTPQKKIGKGETEAIALAIELKVDALLIDDNVGIKEARRLQIPTLRLFTILEQAAEKELLDLTEAVTKITKTNFHLPPAELIEAMLERDKQRKKRR